MRIFKYIKWYSAIKSRWIRERILTDEEKERLIIAEFRQMAMFFGADLSHLSDEQIKERSKQMGESLKHSGITAEQAANAMSLLATSK